MGNNVGVWRRGLARQRRNGMAAMKALRLSVMAGARSSPTPINMDNNNNGVDNGGIKIIFVCVPCRSPPAAMAAYIGSVSAA